LPTYLWGDVIRLTTEVEHAGNLGDAWAVFTRVDEQGRTHGPTFMVDAVSVQEIRRYEDRTVSTVVLEGRVLREHHIPGVYELTAVHGLPMGVRKEQARGAWELGTRSGVRLRIEGLPQDAEAEVRFARLERPTNEQRFYDR